MSLLKNLNHFKVAILNFVTLSLLLKWRQCSVHGDFHASRSLHISKCFFFKVQNAPNKSELFSDTENDVYCGRR